MTENGYAGDILKIDLSRREISRIPSAPYVAEFIGGRGIAAKLYWDMVPPEAGVFDPENCLICTTGPVAGFPGFAGYRWQICGKSAVFGSEAFNYANLSGRFGARLKFAGFDALVIQGQASQPVYVYVSPDKIEIRDAGELWGATSFDAGDRLKAGLGKDCSVLTIGPAAENKVVFATLITDDGASGSAGLGSVMGAKRLKAVVVKGDRKPKAADPDKLSILRKRIKSMRKTPWVISKPWEVADVTQPEICFGCGIGCSRQTYRTEKGQRFKSLCQAACVYMQVDGNGLPIMEDTQFLAVQLCDANGLDTSVMMAMMNWLMACYNNGLVSEQETGLPFSKFGSADFIRKMAQMITYRQGFGALLAQGTLHAAAAIGPEAEALLGMFVSTPGGDTKDYDPRLIPTTALLYATEPRRPIQQLHEPSIVLMMWLKWWRGEPDGFYNSDDFKLTAKRFWGSEIAADFTTYEGKAVAAKLIQDRTYVKESLILCDFTWPMTWADYDGGHVGDPSLESRIFSAITGRDFDEAGLNRLGEKIFNLQRAILLRQGWPGRRGDRLMDYLHNDPLQEGEIYFTFECEVMDAEGKAASRKGNVVKMSDFERLKDEYYQLRGWSTAEGLPTRERLDGLGLRDVANTLSNDGLLGGDTIPR